MPLFDLFGLQKDSAAAGGDTQRLKDSPGLSKKTWGTLLLLDGLFILLCAGGLAARVSRALKTPLAMPAAPSKAVSVKPPEPKPEAKAPGPKAEESGKRGEAAPKAPPAAKAAEAKTPAAAAKGPPSPERGNPSPAKGAPAAPAKPEGISKPVEFTHEDASAKEVNLLGPFLVRTGGSKPMFKDSKGVWRLTIYLKSGETYKYRFEVIDAHGKRKLTEKHPMEVLP